MTGFGRASGTLGDGTEITVTVRGVNHRFLDVSVKLRDELAPLELSIRRAAGKVVSRGHLDLLLRSVRPQGRSATFDPESAARYVYQWREAAERLQLPGELAARDLLGLPGVVRTDEAGELDEAAGAAVLSIVERALADFDASRVREGASLKAALEAIVERFAAGVARLDAERAGLSERLLAVYTERLRKLAGELVEPVRLAQEAAVLADRAEISEEIDRLKTHLVEVRRLLAGDAPSGKRLDFLAQELHREVNTSGAKVREIGATQVVLDLKADVEAFKEQVQNIE